MQVNLNDEREAMVRAMYDAWPHTVISEGLSKLTGLPIGEVLTFDVAKASGADFGGLYRYADAILALRTKEPSRG